MGSPQNHLITGSMGESFHEQGSPCPVWPAEMWTPAAADKTSIPVSMTLRQALSGLWRSGKGQYLLFGSIQDDCKSIDWWNRFSWRFRTWAREVRLTWEICRPSGKTLALHRSWSTGSRGSHLNLKAPANTGGIKKAHKMYPIGGGQQLIALIFGKLEEVEEWTILVPRQTPSLLNCFFHGTQAFPVTQASTRDAKPYLVGGDPSTIAKHLALSESEQDAPDRHQPRLKLLQLLKKL